MEIRLYKTKNRRNMKLYKIFLMMFGVLLFAACDDVDNMEPAGGSLTAAQLQETNKDVPSRTEASFVGLFADLGTPMLYYGTSSRRADDFAFISAAISQDLEGADMSSLNNDYNWFSTACELSTRTPNYANPSMRYGVPYRLVGKANDIINSIPADATDSSSVVKVASARAARAFAYLSLAPYFQFSYTKAADEPCIPMIKEGVDMANNPRATVREVYEAIVEDLTFAVDNLKGYKRSSKQYIDQNVAYGLRARAYLNMGKYAEAAADAAQALKGYTPYTLEEVSAPGFYDINDHNWMWGIIITQAMVNRSNYCSVNTPASWLSPFSGDGYTAGAQCYPIINKMLYDKIPDTDIRKQWWLDGECWSPFLDTQSWDGVTGKALVDLFIQDVKTVMLPYTGVKFGMKTGCGSTLNTNDWPLMRAEEMILVEIEGLAKSGKEAEAKTKLENFVKTYRDPQYTIPTTRSLADEIWFQRRVELWGEGFFTSDAKRQNKPIVRFHGSPSTCNFPEAFVFNIEANDGWLNMRFPQVETNTNLGVVNNVDGSQPVPGQNPGLRDGVTD